MNKSTLFVAFSLVLASCRHDPYIYEGLIVDEACDPNKVYFENDVLPLFQANCATSGCHDAGTASEGVILNNFSNIVNTGDVKPGDPSGSDIFEVLNETDPDKVMPPTGKLPDAQIEIIRQWILDGAQNTACQDSCDTTQVTYNNQISTIISSYCLSCHNASAPQGGRILESYNQVVDAVNNANLQPRVNHQQGFPGMPTGGPMPQCEIDKINAWIQAGMPEN